MVCCAPKCSIVNLSLIIIVLFSQYGRIYQLTAIRHFKEERKYLNIRKRNLSWEILFSKSNRPKRYQNFFFLQNAYFYQINHLTTQ